MPYVGIQNSFEINTFGMKSKRLYQLMLKYQHIIPPLGATIT